MAAICPKCRVGYSIRNLQTGQTFECQCGALLRVPEETVNLKDIESIRLELVDPPAEPPPPPPETPQFPPAPHTPARFHASGDRDAELVFEGVDSELAERLQEDIDRQSISIASFMVKMGLKGGVDLSEKTTADEPGDAPPAPETTPGDLVGAEGRKYLVGKVVKRGGMGAILTARDQNIRRVIAMKVLLHPEDATREQLLRFIEEAQVTGQLEHPNIVPVYELGVDAGNNVFYTMKFVKGVTLESVLTAIREGKGVTIAEYPLTHLLTSFLKACDAMAFAHSRDIIHRDLKPENIMIGEYGEVLVMDWGLAKVIGRQEEGDRAWTESSFDLEAVAARSGVTSVRSDEWGGGMRTLDGQLLGTPQFMAPEQAMGKVDELDARTDVYQLGAILYEILTLRPALTGDNLNAVLMKIVKGNIVSPTEFNPNASGSRRSRDIRTQMMRMQGDRKSRHVVLRHCPQYRIPDSLAAVCMKALARDPADRYQSVQALQRDIEAWQGGYATQAEQAGRLKQFSLLVRRHRTEFGFVLAALLILFGVVAGFVRQIKKERDRAVEISRNAVDTLNKLKAEQAARLELSKAAAPEFLAKAQKLFAESKWNEALEVVNITVSLDYRILEAWRLKGRLHLGNREFVQARDAFRRAGVLENAQLRAIIHKYTNLTQQGKRQLSATQLLTLADEVRQFDDLPVAAHLFKEADNAKAALEARFEAAKKALGPMNPLQTELRFVYEITGASVKLDLSANTELSNLRALEGLPLTSLDLASTKVRNLTVVERMPLTHLNLSATKVRDLGALRGMKLVELNLASTEVTNFNVLPGMPLTVLDLSNTQFGDFDIVLLKGCQLTSLNLRNTEVSDVGVLQKMPLKFLDLSFSNVRDIRSLAGMPLESLDLGNTGVQDITVLKGLPLKTLGLAGVQTSNISALKDMPLTALDVRGTKVADIGPLKGMPLTTLDLSHTQVTGLSPLKGMPLTSLDLEGTKISDFELLVLDGMRLTHLSLAGANVKDLTALKGMPLAELSVESTEVNDITPLKGMPLTTLNLARTRISDVSALAKMPLVSLRLDGCTQLKEVRPLATCDTLAKLLIPACSTDIECLRTMPHLQFLSTRYERRMETAAEFWKTYDESRLNATPTPAPAP